MIRLCFWSEIWTEWNGVLRFHMHMKLILDKFERNVTVRNVNHTSFQINFNFRKWKHHQKYIIKSTALHG